MVKIYTMVCPSTMVITTIYYTIHIARYTAFKIFFYDASSAEEMRTFFIYGEVRYMPQTNVADKLTLFKTHSLHSLKGCGPQIF